MNLDIDRIISEIDKAIEPKDGIRVRELLTNAWSALYHLRNHLEIQKQKARAEGKE